LARARPAASARIRVLRSRPARSRVHPHRRRFPHARVRRRSRPGGTFAVAALRRFHRLAGAVSFARGAAGRLELDAVRGLRTAVPLADDGTMLGVPPAQRDAERGAIPSVAGLAAEMPVQRRAGAAAWLRVALEPVELPAPAFARIRLTRAAP